MNLIKLKLSVCVCLAPLAVSFMARCFGVLQTVCHLEFSDSECPVKFEDDALKIEGGIGITDTQTDTIS